MFLRSSLIATAVLMALSQASWAEGKSIIVLDGSGSMWGQIDGRAKLEIARDALADVLAGVDPAAELGLMAYGHREKGACGDIELIVPPGPGTAAAISDAASAMKFLGKTPLTEAVRQAASELRSTEEKATVILITDGIETCEADPCALGNELEASGVDFTAHVVGFGLTAEEGRTVACLAESTGGMYIEAKDASSLSDALKTTVAVAEPEPAPEPEPEPAPAPEPAKVVENFDPVLILAEGQAEPEEVADAYFDLFPLGPDGTVGERLQTVYGRSLGSVPPGTYRVEARLGSARAEQDVTITDDAVAIPVFNLNAAVLTTTLFISETEPAPDAGYEYRDAAGENVDYGYGQGTHVVPAGTLTLTASLGAASLTETVTLAPGERLEKKVILGTGLAVVEGFYTDAMRIEGSRHFVQIFPAKAALDGSRNDVAYTYGEGAQFDLPPGDYVAQVTLDAASAEVPFTITPGERTDISVVLKAGVAAITAPGADGISFVTAKADINGNRADMGYTFGESYQNTLPAGDYIAIVRRGEAETETPFTVTAGERTEITVAP